MGLLEQAAFALEESTEKDNQHMLLCAADQALVCREREIANDV